LRPPDRLFEEVDTRDLALPSREEEGGVARAAAGVEDGTADAVGHVDERLLRLADVPGRLAGVQGLERAAVGYWRHGPSPVGLVSRAAPGPGASGGAAAFGWAVGYLICKLNLGAP